MRTKTLVTAICMLGLMALSGSALGAPKRALSETSFDFGYVPQNAQITHSFWIHSAGEDDLKILKVIPGCGCTRAPLEKDQIAAGDSARLEIIFSTRTYRGQVAKTPRFETNEGGPAQILEIKTFVQARPDSAYPLTVKPYKLDMSQFGTTERGEVTFSLINRSDTELHPTLVDYDVEMFEITLPKTIEPGKPAEAKLVLKEGASAGEFEKSFTFQVDDAEGSRFTVPVKRVIRDLASRPTK